MYKKSVPSSNQWAQAVWKQRNIKNFCSALHDLFICLSKQKPKSPVGEDVASGTGCYSRKHLEICNKTSLTLIAQVNTLLDDEKEGKILTCQRKLWVVVLQTDGASPPLNFTYKLAECIAQTFQCKLICTTGSFEFTSELTRFNISNLRKKNSIPLNPF